MVGEEETVYDIPVCSIYYNILFRVNNICICLRTHVAASEVGSTNIYII